MTTQFFNVTIGDETREGIASADLYATIEAMQAKHGALTPQIVASGPPAAAPGVRIPLAAMLPQPGPSAAPRARDIVDNATARAAGDLDREWIDPVAEKRIASQIAAAKAAGFTVGTPHYAIGTVVNSWGVDNARAARAEHDALPAARDALAQLTARVRAEERSDVKIPVHALRMAEDGRIGHVETGPTWTPERDVLGALASRVATTIADGARPASFGAYLASCDPMLRAQNFNAWTPRAEPGETAVIRTRKDLRHGGRAAFACVSETYAKHDADEIAQTVLAAVDAAGLADELRARVNYDGRRTQIDLEAHSTLPAESYAAGEIYRAGIRVRSDDTGGGSLGGSAFIGQNLCRNLIILHAGESATFAHDHRGNPADLARKLRAGLKGAIAAARVFVDQWSGACGEMLPGWSDADVKRASDRMLAELLASSLAGAVSRDLIPVGSGSVGSRVKDAVPDLLKMWVKDKHDGSAAVRRFGGLTRAAVVNATTRYAHEIESSPFSGDDLERAGGVILAGGPRIARDLAPATAEDFKAWGTTPAELVKLARIL